MRRGHTLIELLVSMSLLSILTALLFVTYSDAAASYQLTNGRFELQSEMHRTIASLKRELLSSSYYSVNSLSPSLVVPGEPDVAYRGGLAFAQCSRQDLSSYEMSTGRTLFDHYVYYWADSNQSRCNLIKIRLRPNSKTADQGPLRAQSDFAAFLAQSLPSVQTESYDGTYKTLSTVLYSLKTEVIPRDFAVRVTIVLRTAGGHLSGRGKTMSESIESSVQVSPANSFPKL